MDRIKETTDILIAVNKFQKQELADHKLITLVCGFFDKIKDDQLNQADLSFLRYLANVVGIPHFYDLLSKFDTETEHLTFSLNTLSAIIHESTLHTSEESKVHRYQSRILELFKTGTLNRYFLSASTSFGKTHIVFEIIRKMSYKNIVLIFPTIALLSENLERLLSDDRYSFFKDNYTVHTLSEIQEIGLQNLFIFTPERFLSFLEKRENTISFDFAFIDEVYKIDNDYIIDEEIRENERDVAYRLAVFYSLKPSVDVMLAGPYIDFSKANQQGYNRSFDDFLSKNQITLVNYNDYEIVNKSYSDIKTAKSAQIDEHLSLAFSSTNKNQRLKEIIEGLKGICENCIIYCSTKSGVETYSKNLINSAIMKYHDVASYSDFLNHISRLFGEDWVVFRALKTGIGIHHGLIPKYIQKETINLFNKGYLKVLISTTTITEGVNTSAKNLIVLHSKKGDKPLKKFDAKNIAGRAGRFLHHYSGRVIILQNDFLKAIESKPEGIRHKNYDPAAPKDEIDLYYTADEYLLPNDRKRLADIAKKQSDRNIPEDVFNLYKVVSRLDKISVYDRVSKLSPLQFQYIGALISKLNYRLDIDNDGFQVILSVILPIVKNAKLKSLIERLDRNENYSILTHFVHFYLKDGFIGSLTYKIDAQKKSKDEAMRETSEFIYNTLKYQVVKYLGVFNIMYKFYISQISETKFEDVVGIDRLLTKLEYNALTENGRIASDYGVPADIVEYYESDTGQQGILARFDAYERAIFEKIEAIINNPKKGQ